MDYAAGLVYFDPVGEMAHVEFDRPVDALLFQHALPLSRVEFDLKQLPGYASGMVFWGVHK